MTLGSVRPGPRPTSDEPARFPRGIREPAQPLAGAVLVACLLAGLATACDGPPDGRTLRVSAAASLTDAFSELSGAFEQATPGVTVVLNLGGSSGLREQILAGAPADVFASAGSAPMAVLVEAGEVSGAPRTFAYNRLAIAVPTGNPAGITGLADFTREELLIGLCAAEVPCGTLARRALAGAGIRASVDTHEPNVRSLLTKIAEGELDVGIVYATDVDSTRSVEGIELPASGEVVAEYSIAALETAPHPEGAADFLAFVSSERGRAILSRHGFSAP